MLTEPHRGQGQVGCLPLCRKTANQTDRECEALHNQKNKENKSLFPSSNDQFGVGEEDSFQFLLAVHCDLPLPHPFHTHTHTHLPLLPFFLPPPLSSTRFLLVCKGGLTSLPMAAPQALTALGSHVAPTVRPLGQHVVVPGCALSRNP